MQCTLLRELADHLDESQLHSARQRWLHDNQPIIGTTTPPVKEVRQHKAPDIEPQQPDSKEKPSRMLPCTCRRIGAEHGDPVQVIRVTLIGFSVHLASDLNGATNSAAGWNHQWASAPAA